MLEPNLKPTKEQVAQKIIDLYLCKIKEKTPIGQAATLITMGYLAAHTPNEDKKIMENFDDMNYFVDRFLHEFMEALKGYHNDRH